MAGVGSGVYLTPPSDSPKNSLRLGFWWLASLFGFPFLSLFDFVWDSSDLAPMARNPACSVYIGNLDEKVSERVLYEILIQVGHVVDLHIPRDKETNRHKGYAFAEYETEEVANYAVRLFSGLVRLHNKTLKFAMSGQDKSSQNSSSPLTPQANCPPLPNNGPSPFSVQSQDRKLPQVSAQAMVNCRISSGAPSVSLVYPQVYSNGLASNGLSTSNYEYNRRVFGDVLNSVSRPATSHPIAYPSY